MTPAQGSGRNFELRVRGGPGALIGEPGGCRYHHITGVFFRIRDWTDTPHGRNFPHSEARLGLESVESLNGEQTRPREEWLVHLVRSAHDLRGELTSPLCA